MKDPKGAWPKRERAKEIEHFARKLAIITPEDRAEIESIHDCFENTAKRFRI